MACSTVFPIANDLASSFAAEVHAQPPTKSFFQIAISNEELVLSSSCEYIHDPTQVFGKLSTAATFPSYFAVRDPQTPTKWILVMYIPENSKVKDKMLYAATRDTVKRGLGYDNFVAEVACNEQAELSWEQVQNHLQRGGLSHSQQQQPQPLTEQEIRATQERFLETDTHRDAKNKAMLVFPLTQPAKEAVDQFAAKAVSFVQLRLDTEKEQIDIGQVVSGAVSIGDTRQYMASDMPSYNLFHHNSDQSKAFFFLWCPGTAPAKQKMLSATIKRSLVQMLESSNVTIDKQFETDDLVELSEATLLSLVAPPGAETSVAAEARKTATARPARAAKGGKRMIGARKELEDDDE